MWWKLLWCFYPTLILTAPIHYRASIAETLLQRYISPNLMKKQTHLLDGFRVKTFLANVQCFCWTIYFWPKKRNWIRWKYVSGIVFPPYVLNKNLTQFTLCLKKQTTTCIMFKLIYNLHCCLKWFIISIHRCYLIWALMRKRRVTRL